MEISRRKYEHYCGIIWNYQKVLIFPTTDTAVRLQRLVSWWLKYQLIKHNSYDLCKALRISFALKIWMNEAEQK